MTGPAQFARFITVVGVAGALLAPAWSHAAAPRDAVVNMPQISHTSEFKVISPTQSDYQDNYTSDWRIDWSSPDVQLGMAKAKLDLSYRMQLTDFLNRTTGSSNDGRWDYLVAGLHINTLRGLRLDYTFEQSDVYSGSTPSPNPRSYYPVTANTVNLRWELPNLPVMNANYRVSRNYSFFGTTQGGGGEISLLQFLVDYRPATPSASQEYMARIEQTESHNYAIQATGSSQNKTHLEGSREVPLGNLGTLTTGATYEETTSRGDLDAKPRQTLQSLVFLGLNGNVLNFPMTYGIDYRTISTGYNDSPGEQLTFGTFNLNLGIPNPKGNPASLSLANTITDSSAGNRRFFNDSRTATWDFSINPRTSSHVMYQTTSATDNLANVRTEERENINAQAVYQIPGSRGSITTGYVQGILRNPNSGDRNVSHGTSVSSSFALGPQASMGLLFTHSYYDDYSSVLSVGNRTEYAVSGVNYNFNGNHGLSLSANWQQRFQLDTSDRKTDTLHLDLTLNWRMPSNWVYQLQLSSNDVHQEEPGSPTGYTYVTGEEYIRAAVSYSF